MTSAKAMVLMAATILGLAAFVTGAKGTIAVPMSLLLLILAMLATVAALLHMLARWW